MAKPVAEVSEDEDDDLAFLTVKIIDDFEKIQKKSETKQGRFQEIGLFF
jgi:hypothetical protein